MNRPRYEQSPTARGLIQADQATGLAGELVIPAAVGAFVDWYFGTVPWGILIGSGLGFVLMMTHVLQIAAKSTAQANARTEQLARERAARRESEPGYKNNCDAGPGTPGQVDYDERQNEGGDTA